MKYTYVGFVTLCLLGIVFGGITTVFVFTLGLRSRLHDGHKFFL